MAKRWWNWSVRDDAVQLRVLMVCMGNICRSPIAEAVLRHRLASAGLADRVMVESAGTASAHRGSPPDPRAMAQGAARGYDLQGMRSRPVVDADFERFDLLIAMDGGNLNDLRRRCPAPLQDRLRLLLAATGGGDVPDPYYGSVADFELALDLIEPACDALVDELRQRLGPVRT